MATFEDVHAGDVVLGHDGELWGALAVECEPQLAVTLVRHEQTLVARPPAGTAVVIVDEVDLSAETRAWKILTAAGMGPVEIIAEYVER